MIELAENRYGKSRVRLMKVTRHEHGHDLRALLRSGADDVQIAAAIGALWGQRADRYSELRGLQSADTQAERIEMSYIGG